MVEIEQQLESLYAEASYLHLLHTGAALIYPDEAWLNSTRFSVDRQGDCLARG